MTYSEFGENSNNNSNNTNSQQPMDIRQVRALQQEPCEKKVLGVEISFESVELEVAVT